MSTHNIHIQRFHDLFCVSQIKTPSTWQLPCWPHASNLCTTKKIDPCLPWNGLEKPSGTDFFEATEAEVWSNLLASWGPWVYKMLPKHYPPWNLTAKAPENRSLESRRFRTWKPPSLGPNWMSCRNSSIYPANPCVFVQRISLFPSCGLTLWPDLKVNGRSFNKALNSSLFMAWADGTPFAQILRKGFPRNQDMYKDVRKLGV